MRWLAELASFDFEVQHVPGKETAAADALSRSKHLRDPTEEEIQEVEEYIRQVKNIEDELEDIQLNNATILRAQQDDPTFVELGRWVTKGYAPGKEKLKGLSQDLQAYLQYIGVLEIEEDGLLIMKSKDGTRRILIPENEKLKRETWEWSHSNISAGHFGIQGTTQRAKTYFFWIGMDSFLKKETKKCNVCIAKQNKANSPRQTVHQP